MKYFDKERKKKMIVNLRMEITAKLLVPVLVTVLITCGNVAYAKDAYRIEGVLVYENFEDDDDLETKVYGLSVKVHFQPVHPKNHPLAEAAFMERVGHIELNGGQQEAEMGSLIEGDGPFYGVVLNYTQPGNPFVFKAGYTRVDFDFDRPSSINSDSNIFEVGLGYFIKDGFFLGLEYKNVDSELSVAGVTVSERDEDKYTLYSKYVNEIGDGRAWNVEVSAAINDFDRSNDDGNNAIFEIELDYYFNLKISVGAELSLNIGDDKDDEGRTVGIDTTAFINSQFALALKYEWFDAEETEGEDEDVYFIGCLVRF
ncbi:hypothetical protein ACFL6N_02285 [Thermodesulfobacteriota bacterium]